FCRYLVGSTYKNISRLVVRLTARSQDNKPVYLLLQFVPVGTMIFVPYHEIHFKTFQTPISMGLDHLFYEVEAIGLMYMQQHDRQIAGYGIAPEPRLSFEVV